MGQRLRGMENFLCDLLADPATAETLLDGVMEQKLAFWRMALPALADVVDIVVETDDFGTQESQLISEEVYFKLFSPRWHAIFAELRSLLQEHGAGQKGYLFFHSCGNVRPYLPDFIDMGVDILNPVHTRAKGMEPTALKKDFGEAITFWGGGVETQQVLPQGTPQEVRDDVRRNVEALAPGGGYVFNTVHNIQAEVPPENILAMWEAMREFGTY
jgi:uroporphyrinogen decarboxylase